ncbi:FAD-dependent thymidylate synthase [Clostridium estertheticum]|uniref:FAD-dependent thymidylate synthase n=1 Tax=Clostridium estertheticum TaxID=238834 RepID=UPI001CF11EC0|nr:FAD-dependent thymidylate synthase [Clostridium estertheticum]MCB2353063.1 FAD-dependent thymidylate synthase [Clostridium estertheticum]WAG41422.1 FAD-dependent thymidylate synthase [Clostridium estertheticum]
MLKVKLIEHTPNPEKIVAAAAKLCYSQVGIDEILENLDEQKTNKFIKTLMTYGHHSPIEHVSFTFAVEGISRSLTHQLVRHRVASYSQQSQRYVQLKQFEYIIPPNIEKDEQAKGIFIQSMKRVQEEYNRLVEILSKNELTNFIEEYLRAEKLTNVEEIEKKQYLVLKNKAEKKAIEDARYVFPNACETKIIATMNARELMHFFNQRCCTRAQWEIRQMAKTMLMQAREVAPSLFRYAGPSCVSGQCPEGKMCCGKTLEVRKEYEMK